jgi:hypothetical protein
MLKTVGNPSTRYGDQTVIDGDLVIGTAGKGVDFSANPNAPGMTSELLSDYEEGTFTATLRGFLAPPTTPVTTTARYTKIGRQVTCEIAFLNVDTTGASNAIIVDGLPFASATETIGSVLFGGGMNANVGVAHTSIGSASLDFLSATSYTNLLITPGAGQYLIANITYTV